MLVKFVFANPKQWWKQPGAELLRRADGVSASHVAIELETFTATKYFEATFPKSIMSDKKDWVTHWEKYYSYSFEVPAHLQFRVKMWLIGQMKTSYSIPQLILIALCLIEPLNRRLNWAILNHERAMICTELVSRFVEQFMQLELTESHDKMGLRDIRDICETISFKDPERIWK